MVFIAMISCFAEIETGKKIIQVPLIARLFLRTGLWMTTYGGYVWKYDGKELLNFPIKNGKKEVLLISIYKDNQGVLWLGTDNDGVYKQHGENFEKFEPK